MKAGKDYIGLGVGAVIHDGQGRILLLKRSGLLDPSRSTVGLWSNPGGEVDFGETVEQAAVREAREELGVDITVERTIGFSDQILPQAGLHWHLVTFLARIAAGEPRILEPEKVGELRWFRVEELPPDCGLHHVIVPLHQLGWISEEEFRRRAEAMPGS
ncbi:MAG: NUDIX domain-containing protein [Chloroflexota bacterium]